MTNVNDRERVHLQAPFRIDTWDAVPDPAASEESAPAMARVVLRKTYEGGRLTGTAPFAPSFHAERPISRSVNAPLDVVCGASGAYPIPRLGIAPLESGAASSGTSTSRAGAALPRATQESQVSSVGARARRAP